MNRHTPGPWHVGDIHEHKGSNGPDCRQSIHAGKDGVVAGTMKNDRQYETPYIGSLQSLHEKGGVRPGEWETFHSTSQAFPDFLVIRSRVLDRDILVTRTRKLTVPPDLAHLPVFSLQELTALLESGVTREDVPRLFKIREEFSGVFIKPGQPVKPVANPLPATPAQAQKPSETQGDLFA